MLRYFIRRIFLALPTLLIISLVVFGLSKCTSGDPALEWGEDSHGDFLQQERVIRLKAKYLGLDKPAFYFSLTTAAFPDTAHLIFPPSRRERLMNLCAQTGNWPALRKYETALRETWDFAGRLPDTLAEAGAFRLAISDLISCENADTLESLIAESRHGAAALLRQNLQAAALLDTLQIRARFLISNQHPEKMFYPDFHWYGLDNQYHNWLKGFFTGNLGISKDSQKPVWDSLKFSLLSTLLITGLAILFAYLIAVPLGVGMARRHNRLIDRITHGGLLFLYAMPVFWMGGLLILFFATPGSGLYLIKGGIALDSFQSSGKSYGAWAFHYADKFILPIITLCLHILTILALQMRGGVLDCIGQDFVRTARAKGVGEHHIYWRHVFRNAVFPIISVFASIFPIIFAGSLVIEYLFQFPGLGMKTHEAFMHGDFPVLFSILMLAATLAVTGNLIADLLYAWVDPRVRFVKN
ncbi:MAG: ABC transporter permease [Lewinellaceae bacterium]|nr:ABC transporter permease [Lewinellaceae bacterium]